MPDSPGSFWKYVKILIFFKSVSLKQLRTLECADVTVKVHWSGIHQTGMPNSPASLQKIVKMFVFSKRVSLKQIKTLENYLKVSVVVQDNPERLDIARKQLTAD